MSRTLCPDCGANRGVQTSTNLSYCHSCHKAVFNKSLIKRINKIETNNLEIPNDLTLLFSYDPIIKKARDWLSKYYITLDHCRDHNIFWSNKLNRIIFIYNKGKSAWARSINPNVRSKWLHLGEKKDLYITWNSCKKHSIFIVEDCISAIRLSDYVVCISLGGTNIHKIKKIETNNVTLWFDGDIAGQKAAEAFRKKFKLYLNIRNIVTKKDPKCHTPSEMEEILNETIQKT